MIRYEYAEPGELIHVDIKKLGRILKPGHRVTGDRSRRGERQGRLAAPVRRDRRPQPARLRRRLPRRDRRQRDRVPRRARPLLQRSRDHRGAGPDRQRQLLQTTLGRRLRPPRHHGQEDARLPAPDQRESGTVHPHPARALGLRLPLRQRTRPTRRRSHPPSTSTIASVPTAPSTDSHRSSASTTSLGQTARSPSGGDRREFGCERPAAQHHSVALLQPGSGGRGLRRQIRVGEQLVHGGFVDARHRRARVYSVDNDEVAQNRPVRSRAILCSQLPGWRNWSYAPDLKSGVPRDVWVRLPAPA